MPQITPFLWFDDRASEAIEFYLSIVPEAERLEGNRIRLCGQEFICFDGGPACAGFARSISFMVACETQSEIDRLWEALGAGGEPGRCGWLDDKFGLTWQIVPARLGELLNGDDDAGSEAALEAMLAMSKLDLAALEAAYAGARVAAETRSPS